MKSYKPISFKKVKRYSLKERKSKVLLQAAGRPHRKGNSLKDFVDSLPDILGGADFKTVVSSIVRARQKGRPVVLSMGAHPIKVGLSPIIIDLMRQGIVTAIATNGAAIVHDFEIALQGQTSEDVASELSDGSFGMARETGRLLNNAIKKAAKKSMGLGEAVGELILKGRSFKYKEMSLFSEARRLNMPATVHVAFGTDIIHMHPECDGAAIGKTSYHDFKLFTSVIADLEGGVFINLGSAVIMPEVFLKALTIARNLGHRVKDITTVTLDFMRQYRPMVNVVHRPTLEGGRGIYITGHHEIMFPLLAAAVKEYIPNPSVRITTNS